MDRKGRRPSYNEANRLTEIYPENSEPKSDFIAADGCHLLDRDLTDKTELQFYEFQTILKYFGLLFKTNSHRYVQLIQRFWLSFLVIIGIYSTSYDIYWLIMDFNANYAPSILSYTVIIFQASVSLLFLSHWHQKLDFQEFFHIYRHAKILDVSAFDENHNRHYKRNKRQFWIVQIYALINLIIYSVAYQSNYMKKIIHPALIRAYYFPQLRVIRPFLACIYLSVVNNNMHTYLCLTNALHWELKKFNYKIMELKSSTAKEMKEKLEDLIYLHTKLSGCIKAMDQLYRVFAFAITASVIPLTICILALVLSRTTFAEFMISLPPVFVCSYELYGVMYSARLHGEASKSKSLLCMNHNVWIPYEESVNKIAHTLAMHLEQPDLGVSLWGFTLVTKPLVLTTISAMMTCLALFLDLKPKEKNLALCHCPNSSVLT